MKSVWSVIESAWAGSLTDSITSGLNVIKGEVPTPFGSIEEAIAKVFNIVISLSGAIFVILLLIGGVYYLTNAGNEEGTGKAKKLMINALIGLVITLAAWAVGIYILGQVGFSGVPSNGGGGSGGGGDGNDNSQPFPVQFEVKNASTNGPVQGATVYIDSNLKGETSSNGRILVIITNPKPAGQTYFISVQPPRPCQQKTGNFTLDRGTLTNPSKLTVQLDCL